MMLRLASHARRATWTPHTPSPPPSVKSSFQLVGSTRHQSFKAFAKRNDAGASVGSKSVGGPQNRGSASADAAPANSAANSSRSSNDVRGGAFSNMITKRTTKQSSRPSIAAQFPSHDDPTGSDRNRRGPTNAVNPPWQPRQNQQRRDGPDEWSGQQHNTGFNPNHRSNDFSQQRSNTPNTIGTLGGSRNNNGPPSNEVVEDLKDISALRNTFMPNKGRESWRTPPSSDHHHTAGMAGNYPNRYGEGDRRGGPHTNNRGGNFRNNRNNNHLSSRPSNYKNTSSNTPSEGQSLEQVLRANAQQRKQDMVERYKNAGERVPFNIDEYGNSTGGSNLRSSWRNAGRNNHSYNNQYQEQHYNQQQSQEDAQRQRVYQRNQWNRNSQIEHQSYQKEQHQRFGQRQQPDPIAQHLQNSQQPFGNGNRQRGRGGGRGRQRRNQRRNPLPASAPTSVRLPSTPLTLVDLSLLLRVRKRTIVRTLRSLGEPIAYTTANQDSFKIDPELMEYICVDLGIEPLKTEKKESGLEEAERRALRQSSVLDRDDDDEARTEEEERYAALPPRSPVVSIMGHVDHGKTTLMDALRRRAVTTGAMKPGCTKEKKGKKKKKKEAKQRGGKGNTTLVDSDNVAGTEAGGITQVITAFEVPLPFEESGLSDEEEENKPISTVTFLDTPGHAAFKKMRQSGSSATDVIVLVVAADDGVSPQTVEIIEMFKSIARSQPQSISLVVAVSKIDKPGIDVDEAVMRIENQLIEHEILTENVLAGGGDEGEFGACQLFPVSGITGDGLDDLIEGLGLQSEIMDLRADEEARGEGIVIDARMEKGLGVVADCVIRWGKVEQGDFVVSGTNGGRVKFLNDGECLWRCIVIVCTYRSSCVAHIFHHRALVANKPLKRARPSQPVRIVGFKTLPKAGDPIVCAASEDEAKELIRLRESELMNEERADFEADIQLQVTGTAAKQGLMLQRAHEKYGFDGEADEDDDAVRIPVVIKADSHGALEAVRDALVSIGTDSKLNIVIDPVEMSTGVVTTSDVRMARESDAAIFVFGKVGIADKETKSLAESEDVSIRGHDIIYRLLEDAKEYFGKYLPVEYALKVHGKANVQAVFEVTDANKKEVSIAGLRVSEGTLFKLKSKPSDGGESLHCFYRVLRKGEVIASEDDKLKASSLRKVKEDVDSVRNGEECGLGIAGFNDLKEGDVVECYSIVEKRVTV